MRYLVASVAASLVMAGCIFSNEDRVDVSISYSLTDADSAGSAPNISRVGNLVSISHYFATPTKCYSFASSATQSGTLANLVIRQTGAGAGVCPDSLSTWRYNAVLVGVEATAQRLGINYERDGSPNRTEYPLP